MTDYFKITKSLPLLTLLLFGFTVNESSFFSNQHAEPGIYPLENFVNEVFQENKTHSESPDDFFYSYLISIVNSNQYSFNIKQSFSKNILLIPHFTFSLRAPPLN